jgi:hypothetical protein
MKITLSVAKVKYVDKDFDVEKHGEIQSWQAWCDCDICGLF